MADTSFAAPGPGGWELDRSHYPGGTTPIAQWLMAACPIGMRRAFDEYGMPVDTLDVAFVEGFMYTRLRPLISPDRPATKLPPKPVLALAVRLHPLMRRRAQQAARVLASRPWRRVVADWESRTRPRLEAENLALQAVDGRELDDAALADHLEHLLETARADYELHFYLHAFDLGPTGLLLHDAARWGLAPHEVVPALAGASPSTSAPARALGALRTVVRASGTRPSSLEELRALGPEAAALLDDYLRRRGRMLVTRYDVDGLTLDEQPHVVLATVLDGADTAVDTWATGRLPSSPSSAAASQPESIAEALRARVPVDERSRFDERLAEARAAMDLRDDNGPHTVEWPLGILRHALLAAGERLVERGRLRAATDMFEVEPDELSSLVRTGRGPSAEELTARAADRRRQTALDPPSRLGPVELTPPLEVLAPAHRELVGAVSAVLNHMGMAGERRVDPLVGDGVGHEPYRGRARLALDPEAALDALEPGDVLVVRFTSPAYNTVLTLAGAIVTAEGGLLSHAAVMARELGIPAVVGAPGALRDIPDGATVEVDPAAGRVRVLESVAG